MDAQLHAQIYEEVRADIESLKRQLDRLEAVAAYHLEKSRLELKGNGLSASHAYGTLTVTPASQRFAKMGQREAAEAVLREAGQPLKTAEIADRLIAGGHQSSSDNLRTSLFTSLARDTRRFRKAGPGLWELASDDLGIGILDDESG